jgi:glutathione synthase
MRAKGESMPLHIAYMMDPLETVLPYKDTTYFLMLAAQERGHRNFHFQPGDLFLEGGKIHAKLSELQLTNDSDQPFLVSPPKSLCLDDMQAIWLRSDPPFDRRYAYATLLLDLVQPKTLIVNRPSSLRDWNEKLAAFFFASFTPDSLVARDRSQIRQFMAEKGRIVLKPIDGHGGRGIFFLQPEDPNCDQILAAATHNGQHWVIAQSWLAEAEHGDKRILLLQGEPLGAILRVHAEGKQLNNLDAGGSAQACELSIEDLALCAALREPLKQRGLFFVGIDVIGNRLMEINVTSPTGLQQMARFSGQPLHHRVVEALEKALG